MKSVAYVLSLIFVLTLAVGPMTGCGGKKPEPQPLEVRATTKGQELEDLNNAYKKGILTQEEYEKQKEMILDEK